MTGCFCIHPKLNTCGFNRIREATVITTEALLRGDCCLQLATAEAIDQRVITGYYANAGVVGGFGVIPSDYSSITLLSVMIYCLR